MSSNGKLSIIIAAYNTNKQYLYKCVKSALNQTYADKEIIIVDDGSAVKIENYFSTNNQNIRIIYRSHRGLISARMSGLALISSDYFTFLDSDDWIESDYYENIMRGFENSRVDISIGGYVTEERDGRINHIFQKCDSKIMNKDNAIIEMFEAKNFNWSACDKIYRAKYKNLYANWWESSSYGEDSEFNWKAFNHANKVCFQPLYGYHYCMNPESMMHKKYNPEILATPRRHLRMISEANSLKLKDVLWNVYVDELISYEEMLYNENRLTVEFLEPIYHMINKVPARIIKEKISTDNRYRYFCRTPQQIISSRKRQVETIKKYGDYKKYIYGAGAIGQEIANLLKYLGIDFEGYIVSEKKNDSCEIAGKKVYSLNDISRNDNNTILLLALNENNTTEVINNIQKTNTYRWVNLGKYSFRY